MGNLQTKLENRDIIIKGISFLSKNDKSVEELANEFKIEVHKIGVEDFIKNKNDKKFKKLRILYSTALKQVLEDDKIIEKNKTYVSLRKIDKISATNYIINEIIPDIINGTYREFLMGEKYIIYNNAYRGNSREIDLESKLSSNYIRALNPERYKKENKKIKKELKEINKEITEELKEKVNLFIKPYWMEKYNKRLPHIFGYHIRNREII